ncbi:MAG TPA: glycosyltransferase family 9 protein [Chlamydiales bacterium]|nr:glycosyltransferase family 9 protein [Chlamydiales bacterium]
MKQLYKKDHYVPRRAWRLLNSCLSVVQTFSRLLSAKLTKPPQVNRILLSNWASLGDVLLSTSVVHALKKHFPTIQIGFLVSSNSKQVLEHCREIDWIHTLDPWDSPNKTRFGRLLNLMKHYLFSSTRVIKEIKKINYDHAIELRPFFPNTITVLSRAQIPHIIGFNSSGNTPLLSKCVPWVGNDYVKNCYKDLLIHLGLQREEMDLKCLVEIPAAVGVQFDHPYIIFHLCSSVKEKDVSIAFWAALYEKCKAKGLTVYFTGKGARDRSMIQQITSDLKENLCDQLTWSQLCSVIKNSKGIVSVDSVPIHIAAALSVPFIVLFQRTHELELWFPTDSKGVYFDMNQPVDFVYIQSLIDQWH